MKKRIILYFIILSTTLYAKPKTSVIAETTVKIESQGDQALYYGFNAGDRIEFSADVQNDESIHRFEITELPSNQRFNEYSFTKIRNKVLIANRKGIYKFKLYNNSPVFKLCKLIIKRTPAADSTANFNSSVYWHSIQDTTYLPIEEKYVIKSDTLVQEVYSGNPQIPGRYAITSSKNYQIIDFQLPENTILWSFFIGTGSEAKEVFKKARSRFTLSAASVASNIPEYGPMAALALTGVSYFSSIQGNDNVKYWFLPDGKSVTEFQKHKSFQFYKKGDVTTEASQMRWPLKGIIHLAVMNDNSFETIDLTLKVTTIHVNQSWGKRNKQEMKVVSIEEPYLKQ